MVVLPPLKSISPDDSNAAPISEITTANRIENDFFSRKKNIMARATANGYMKWMVDATPLAMCWYAMTRLNEVAARKRLNMNTVPKSFRLIQNVSPKKMPNMISVNDATPDRKSVV